MASSSGKGMLAGEPFKSWPEPASLPSSSSATWFLSTKECPAWFQSVKRRLRHDKQALVPSSRSLGGGIYKVESARGSFTSSPKVTRGPWGPEEAVSTSSSALGFSCVGFCSALEREERKQAPSHYLTQPIGLLFGTHGSVLELWSLGLSGTAA